MSLLNSGQINAIPINAPGPATDRDVYLSLSTDLEYTLDLALDFEYSLTLLVTVAEVAVTTVDIGDVVRIKGTFLNDASAAVDPTTVTFSVQEPDGTITSYAYGTSALVSKVSTGVYRLKFTPTDTGAHSVRCVGTGSGAAAEKTSFLVRDPY